MTQGPPSYEPTTLEKFFELLDNKLVTLGIPGALCAVGINYVRTEAWRSATLCFAGAAAVWLVIKVGKKLAPKLDQALDWGIDTAEAVVRNGWSTLRSDFEGKYLRQQARLYEELNIEGFNPDRTAIPLLEEVFVPLDLSGAVSRGLLDEGSLPQKRGRWQRDAELMSEHLDIWKLLRRSRHDRKFRKLVILAKGGMGKTTLMRHIALIYGQRKQRRYRAPRLLPVLLRLRDWGDILSQQKPPSLPKLIADYHVPGLSHNHPLTPPPQGIEMWATIRLAEGLALVMFDGFDEVPEEHRASVSRWISAQMQEYDQSVFILTSRPKGFEGYVAQKPTIPLYINKFTPDQQADFIQRWYLCQERCCRSERQRRQAQEVAQARSANLIQQLQERREELGHMAENPLLLNMLVTFHRFDPTQQLPQQRLGLYRGICKLWLEDRPRARGIQMVLPFEKSQILLRGIAVGLVKQSRLTVPRSSLLKFLEKQPLLRQEEVEPADWIRQMLEVSELLVEREPKEYEFPHNTFLGFFAATQLAQTQDEATIQKNMQLILQNWSGATPWWETVLLYTAQLPPRYLDAVIRNACNQGSEAAALAKICVQEYPRPEKLSDDLTALLQDLNQVTQDSTYQTLETLLKNGQWEKADYETYRLMITNPSVDKEERQYFTRDELLNFPCDDLKTIDRLWVHYSGGKFGFSVQKKIWQNCGSPIDSGKNWDRFCVKVGWQTPDASAYVSYNNLRFNPEKSPVGELPARLGLGMRGFGYGGGFAGVGVLFSRAETCEL